MKRKLLTLAIVPLLAGLSLTAVYAQQDGKTGEEDTKTEKPETRRETRTEVRTEVKVQAQAEKKPRKPARPEKPKPPAPGISKKHEKRDLPEVRKPLPPPPRGQKKAFLGVATSAVDPSLRSYLELEDGFGVQVREAIPGSPARDAGLKAHDILVKFEDQWLISPEHLSLLVGRKKIGDEVEVTVIRKGAEKVIGVTLGETDAPAFPRHGMGVVPHPGHPPAFDNPKGWQDYMRKQQDYWRDWVRKNHLRDAPPLPEGDPSKVHPKIDGRPPAVSVKPGFPVSVLGVQGMVKIDNDGGEVVIREEDGKHSIEIRDAEGELVHEGEFDPVEGIEGLPPKAREQLEDMKLDDLEVLAPKAPDTPPKKISDPAAGGDAKAKKEGLL